MPTSLQDFRLPPAYLLFRLSFRLVQSYFQNGHKNSGLLIRSQWFSTTNNSQ
ncbi:MAG: hypothetical protein LBO06_01505 [Bacteroidales bacterium]|nr:hypothetical protein [Bacteroidales bacterium]